MPYEWIEVLSPHDGRPVRVRDKDVGRSVRDGEGKVFFVLPRSDGQGYYGSLTRTGGPKEEQRYAAMVAKEGHAKAVGAELTRQQVHDATGRRRSSWRGKLVILVLLGLVLALVYLFTVGPYGKQNWPWQKPPSPPPPQQQPAQPEQPGPTGRAGSAGRGVMVRVEQDQPVWTATAVRLAVVM